MISKEITDACEREDCSFTESDHTATVIGWTPTYDKKGNRTDVDPNTYSSVINCSTCGMKWQTSTQHGVTTTAPYVAPDPETDPDDDAGAVVVSR